MLNEVVGALRHQQKLIFRVEIHDVEFFVIDSVDCKTERMNIGLNPLRNDGSDCRSKGKGLKKAGPGSVQPNEHASCNGSKAIKQRH